MAVGRERTARAIAIRDHVLPLMQLHGAPQRIQAGELSMVVTRWEQDELSFLLRTPFTRLPTEVVGRTGSYNKALLIQKAPPMLPYGLDIWHNRKKTMSLQWSEGDAAVDVVSFRPGPWKAEVLALK
jgi:hypothetical protein